MPVKHGNCRKRSVLPDVAASSRPPSRCPLAGQRGRLKSSDRTCGAPRGGRRLVGSRSSLGAEDQLVRATATCRRASRPSSRSSYSHMWECCRPRFICSSPPPEPSRLRFSSGRYAGCGRRWQRSRLRVAIYLHVMPLARRPSIIAAKRSTSDGMAGEHATKPKGYKAEC